MKHVIIYLGFAYSALVTTFVFDLGLNPFDNTQISEFLLLSLLMYFSISVFGYIISSPKNHMHSFLRFIPTKRFLTPTCFVFGLAIIPIIVNFSSGVLISFLPMIDKYTKIDSFWLEHLKVTNIGFNISEISDTTELKSDKIIRIYKMPSFENEKLIELRYQNSEITVFAFTPLDKSIWEDRQFMYQDSNGEPTGGRVLGLNEYIPSIKINQYFTTSRDIQELIDSLRIFEVAGMNSITRETLFGLGNTANFDGTTFIIDVLEKGNRNTFEFWEQVYNDHRYNWIIDNFDGLFEQIQKSEGGSKQ